MRNHVKTGGARLGIIFLSIQAQDFIEDSDEVAQANEKVEFLSIQAQDFIEDTNFPQFMVVNNGFLSIQAQDFIEDWPRRTC